MRLEPRTPGVPRVASFAIAIALAALLGACTSIGPKSTPVATAERAEQYAQAGRHEDAARAFESLAAAQGGAAAGAWHLRAAREWLAAHRYDDAARAAAAAAATGDSATQAAARLVAVEIPLARGDTARARAMLDALPVPVAGAAAERYFDVRQRVEMASGRYAAAVRASMTRETYLTTPEARRANRIGLLDGLRAAVENGAKIVPDAERDPVVRGWLELGPIAAGAATMPTTIAPAIQRWRSRYPGHPASEVVRTEIELAAVAPRGERAAHLALLLPVSGRQAAAAAQIRDGFFTAYYQSPAGQRPRVRVYDTAVLGVAEAIARANDAGATVIVGPLLREEVAGAASFAGPRPMMLALNFLAAEQAVPEQFWQFALSPENEARSIADRVVSQGQRRGIALVPSGEWGARVLAAFREELVAGGGELVGTATYFPAENDYSAAITDVLRIDASKARHRRLERALGMRLAFQPRRRADAEFIFAPAQAQIERQLRPQLRFHYAGDLPTYSTSDAYEPNPAANLDLEGLIFPDMPWVFGVGARTATVREALIAAWGENGAARGKLFAFGYDAYQLGLALPGGSATDIDGLTGRLRIEGDRRVRRELDWARIVNGQPQLLDAGAGAPAAR